MTGHYNEVHILVQLTFPCLGAGEPEPPDVAWIFGLKFLGYDKPLAIQYTYIYTCLYIYMNIWLCVYIYIHIWLCIYTYIWLCIYICICMYVWMDGWMHACMFLRYPWIPWFSIGSMIDSFSGPSHRDWWLKSTSETTSLKPKMGTSPNQHGHHLKTTQPSTGYVTSMTKPTQIPSNGTFTNHYCELREPQTFHMKHHKQCNQS